MFAFAASIPQIRIVLALLHSGSVATSPSIKDPPQQERSAIMSPRTNDLDVSNEDLAMLKALNIAVYPTTGADAMRDWERLRAAGGGVPVVVDPSHDFFRSLRWLGAEKHAAKYRQTLQEAQGLDSPADLVRNYTEMKTKVWNEEKEELEDPHSDLPLTYFDEATQTMVEITPEQARARLKARVDGGPLPEGIWPEGQEVADVDWFSGFGNAQNRYVVLVVPAQTASEALAYLCWGAQDDTDPAKTVATVKTWEERYGVELVGLADSYQIFKPERPPQTRQDALQLALELQAYSTVEELNRSVIAQELMHQKTWFIWWD
jgi:hypothetical protein